MINMQPFSEPQLGRRGLYHTQGGHQSVRPNAQSDDSERDTDAMIWILSESDGEHSLLDIAERSGLPWERIDRVARILEEHALLEPAAPNQVQSSTILRA